MGIDGQTISARVRADEIEQVIKWQWYKLTGDRRRDPPSARLKAVARANQADLMWKDLGRFEEYFDQRALAEELGLGFHDSFALGMLCDFAAEHCLSPEKERFVDPFQGLPDLYPFNSSPPTIRDGNRNSPEDRAHRALRGNSRRVLEERGLSVSGGSECNPENDDSQVWTNLEIVFHNTSNRLGGDYWGDETFIDDLRWRVEGAVGGVDYKGSLGITEELLAQVDKFENFLKRYA